MTTKSIRKSSWNTHRTAGYTYDVANDQASAGGVHHHQVRLLKAGWQQRIRQSNGRHESYGKVSAISASDGEARFATAQQG